MTAEWPEICMKDPKSICWWKRQGSKMKLGSLSNRHFRQVGPYENHLKWKSLSLKKANQMPLHVLKLLLSLGNWVERRTESRESDHRVR